MEIVALYTSPETLPTALAAGARHLAAIVEGFALVYRPESDTAEPDGWAGFTCAKDAQVAGEHLAEFRKRIAIAEAPILIQAPDAPPRIWARAAGGVYGFALRHCGGLRGVAMVGCPGPWPRIRTIVHKYPMIHTMGTTRQPVSGVWTGNQRCPA